LTKLTGRRQKVREDQEVPKEVPKEVPEEIPEKIPEKDQKVPEVIICV